MNMPVEEDLPNPASAFRNSVLKPIRANDFINNNIQLGNWLHNFQSSCLTFYKSISLHNDIHELRWLTTGCKRLNAISESNQNRHLLQIGTHSVQKFNCQKQIYAFPGCLNFSYLQGFFFFYCIKELIFH